MTKFSFFFNRCFDKQRLKNFILWFFNKYGAQETIQLLENLKKIGFQYATEAGISIGIDDLRIPYLKSKGIDIAEKKNQLIEINYLKGHLTELEKQQQFVEEWNLVSETLKNNVIQFFKTTDVFNPIYMIAFSGARGNISQVRQLVAMRGLMVDPQGQILDFPIRSNFREGLNLTEYIISCYGARKGVVDTALRTATSGYLTRRLVDVAQQVIIGQRDCGTCRGISMTNLLDGSKTLLKTQDRLIGRILLKDILVFNQTKTKKYKIGFKNQEISSQLASKLSKLQKPIFLRSPLTCHSKNAVCQMCYGWSLAHNTIVSIGEAIGVLAAQSIGEPGTQLTMRTFHTGGIFTGGFIDQIFAPFNGFVEYLDSFQGLLIRTLNGQIGFLVKTEGRLQIKRKISINKKKRHPLSLSAQYETNLINNKNVNNFLSKIKHLELKNKNQSNFTTYFLVFNIPIFTTLLLRQGSFVFEKDLIAELSSSSFLDNQRQETEKEIFSPTSGQVFFEDLVLVEKITRDGNLHRMAYGLGSIWIVAGLVLNKILDKASILKHGDLIGFSSPLQKVQILIENSYHLDLKLSYSIQKVKLFKSKSFSTHCKHPISKLEYLNNLFIKKDYLNIDFQKIQYRNFQYLVFLNWKNRALKVKQFNFIHFLTYRYKVLRKKYFYWDQNNHKISINFHFNQEIFSFYAKKQKPNFFVFSVSFLSKKLSRKFLFYPPLIYKIKPKLQKPIFSRKKLSLNQFNLSTKSILFWVNFIEPLSLSEKLNFLKLYNWVFYVKHLYDKNNYLELPGDNRICFKSKRSIIRCNISRYSFDKKIFKNFFKKSKIINPMYSIYLPKQKFNNLDSRARWISRFQSFFILLNQQGFFNFQLFTSWSISQNFSLETDSFFFNKRKNYPYLMYFEQKLNEKAEWSNFYKSNQIKNNIKPFLLNKNIIIKLSIIHGLLISYIVQELYFLFYKKNQILTNTKNLVTGFKSRFKITLIPNFDSIHYKKEKRKKIKFPIRNKDQSCNKIGLYLQKKYFVKFKFYKSEKFLNWPYTSKTLNWLSFFNNIYKKGSTGLDGVHFDNHEIMIDFIYFYSLNFVKNNLKNHSQYHHIINVKVRFLTIANNLSNIILFQKVDHNINQKEIFLKKRILTQIFCNYNAQISLVFNSILYYYNLFKRSDLVPKIPNNQYAAFEQIKFKKIKKNCFFPKTCFIYKNFLKMAIKFNGYSFLTSYSPIYAKGGNKFFKKNIEKPKTKFFPILIKNSYKKFYLSRIKKLDFKTLDFKIQKKSNVFTNFYSIFKPAPLNNVILINTFLNVKNGEFISIREKKEKTDFTILTQFVLESLLVKKLTTLINQNNLKIGKFIRFGDNFGHEKIITRSGQIIYIDKSKIITRKAIPFLITSRSRLNVYQNEIIEKNTRLFTFFYHQIKTGDIIQGIPKIEEFFEARITREGTPLLKNLHSQVKYLFNNYNLNLSLFEATQKSFETIQQVIVNEIQKIYCSQGIYIADKHLEIIVRQMTSKVQILEGDQTGLLAGELFEFNWIRLLQQKLVNYEILYEPIILGITKSCLETESFISAASFQETTRILGRAAIQNKVDFVRGLKQNVILGNLIPAGTGFLPFK